ncbi:MAG: hypothetical protein QNJ34_11010 [Xenococcaceae cyanobacterium MO_188.B29]|nr:hypothetical protein [Xenococcaceae cyanobacterium MO_188.B29]
MTGKYGDLLKKAKQSSQESVDSKTEIQQDVKPEIQQAVKESIQPEEKEVSLTIKVPISWRQHWVAECKREGKTLKEVVTEMLTEKYGKP